MVENCFYSIEIRDLNFEYDKYYLSLEEDPNNFLITNNSKFNKKFNKNLPKKAISDITPYTIVPKFSIDRINTPILFQIFNIDYNNLIKKEEKEKHKEINDIKEINDFDEKEDEDNIINEPKNNTLTKKQLYLKSLNMTEITLNLKSYTTNKIVFSFQLRYPLFRDFYTFLGEKPDKFKILQYPCILLQYESGSIISNANQPKKRQIKNKSDDNKNKNDNNNELNSGYYALKKIIISKKNEELFDEEINFAIKNEVMEQIFINRQKPMKKKEKNLIILQNILNIKGTYDSTLLALEEKKKELNNKKNEFKKILEKRKEIMNQRKEIHLYEKQIKINKNSWNRLVTLKEILNKINTYTSEFILLKEKKLSRCNQIINKYKNELEEKKVKKISNLEKINKGLQISNFFLIKYAINEISYYFFNNNINIYRAFPTFYNLNLNALIQNKKSVEDFYNSNFREVSTLFGNLVYLLTYISKKFDIIFPYVLFYNGSKSMAFVSIGTKNNGLDLYIKENEKNMSLGVGQNENDINLKMEIISKMIYDVIMFFYSKGICSENFKIDDINNKRKRNKKNMYINLIKLNELFKDILGKTQN